MRVSLFAIAFLKLAIATTEQEVEHGASGTPLRKRSSSHHKSSLPRRVDEKYDDHRGLTKEGKQLASMSLSMPLPTSLPNIYDTASSVDIFSTLVAAVDAAGKEDALSNYGPFTVFAPTNSAFEKVDAALVVKLLDPVWLPQLQDLILYHMLGSVVRSTDLVDGMTAAAVNREGLIINLDPARVNEDSLILVDDGLVDVEAYNGVIHGIDTVLIPTSVTSNIVDIAVANDDFSTLVAALTAAGLVDALSGDGPYTVFAPTNAAFEALPDGTLESLLLPENKDKLTEILTYHVVAANAPSTSLASGEIATLSGESIAIEVSDTGVMVNDANVITPNVIASNGILHIIDRVLLPSAKCAFCPNGLTDPTLVLPTDDQATCAQAAAFAGSMLASDATCDTVQLAEAFCCPVVIAVVPETTTTTTEAPVTVALPVDGQCACSPLVYNFELNLDSDCDTDTLKGKTGIGLTFCFLGSNGKSTRRLGSARQLSKDHVIEYKDSTTKELTEEEQQDMRQLGESIEIISVQFLEFDTSGNLIVINQDDNYSNTSLTNGDIMSFKSIAENLDPDVSIGDQLDYVPGGVQLTLKGKLTNDLGEESVVSNRITWSYTNACDELPIESGDAIGWVTTDEITPPSEAFCPAVLSSAIITTEAPPATTEAPTVTDAPLAATTVSPPDMSMPVTDAPPAATHIDPPDMSMPSAKSSKAMFGKTGKSKATKTKKQTDIVPKTHKTPKNPMAKVAKESSEDGQGGKGKASSVDTKSGKSVIDMDTKAQKASKMDDDGMHSGKAGKMSKNGGKSSKGGGDKSMDSAKSGKSGGLKDDMKGSKATKLFKKKMSL